MEGMEKLSSFDRIVGNVSEAEKERILREKGERFDDQSFEDVKGKEREKTPEELQIISLVNEATNEVRRRYGLDDFNISPENFHVITEEAWPRERSVAFFNSMLQAVAMREKLSNLAFMKTVFHEMLHFKSYNAAQITTGENPELDEYRLGLTVHTRDGKRMYFLNLNEAVMEEMTKRFARQLLKNPLFTDEIKQTRDVMAQHPQAVTDSGKPLFDEDTFYAEVQSSKSWRESVDRLFGRRMLGSGITKISIEGFTYQQERKILNALIDKIFERNPEKFQDREDVFEIFSKGMMTGDILPLGRLIERTFGNGTLRSIGELDQNIRAQEEFVNSL
jgi:hypothetical protein